MSILGIIGSIWQLYRKKKEKGYFPYRKTPNALFRYHARPRKAE